jgi:uncharacterized protein (DUF488 family)
LTEVLTIGAYGWQEREFFASLSGAEVVTFCDIRRRRGVRGADYAFVNSRRLQARLGDIGVAYVHRLDLAPSPETRRLQAVDDARMGVAKRLRSGLGDSFVRAYRDECLAKFDAHGFLADFGGDGPVCLFCVERDPAGCHRLLVAERLQEHGAHVRHLLP